MADSHGSGSNWTQKLEDFIDDGNFDEAKKFLEVIVSDLENTADSSTNLSLAAALTDLASVYHKLGLSIKADSCSTSAFLIKKRVEARSSPANSKISNSLTGDLKTKETRQLDEKHEEPSTSASACEEEWETALSQGLLKLDGFATPSKSPEALPQDRVTYKQRGRGAFTYGEMGMYSDRLIVSPYESLQHIANTDESDINESSDPNSKVVACGVRHVLVITFPPTVIAKDLENLFGPFSASGVAIRWVNDTTALAVFRNPELAREALQSIKNPQYTVQELTEDNNLVSIINEQDLQPPVPRPATSSQAAHRMIMGALRRQGLKSKSADRNSLQQSQKQESERKQRLLSRQKLRDEAWGEDG